MTPIDSVFLARLHLHSNFPQSIAPPWSSVQSFVQAQPGGAFRLPLDAIGAFDPPTQCGAVGFGLLD